MKSHPLSRLVAIVLSYLTFSSLAFAQEPPIKWGEIPREDLEMKSFPQDTNASAVILCDFGESSFNDDLTIVYHKHLRVKILTTKGYSWGTHVVTLQADKSAEWIDDIEGITYNLDDQNNIVKNELKDVDILKENVNDYWIQYRFILPGLKPGCVIEIRYTIKSKGFGSMRDWIFQYSEPVRWSEYRIQFPKAISYSAIWFGYEPFFINETRDTIQIFMGKTASFLADKIAACYQMRWAVKDAPGLRNEPYITTMHDYYNKVDIQLRGYTYDGRVEHIMDTWPSLINKLLDSRFFYRRISNSRTVRKCAEKIVSGITLPEEKLKAIYDWVIRSIVWSGEKNIFANQEVDDVLESKKGNNAEITILLLSLLKSVGIEGDPIMLSTRSNGKVQEAYPMLSQFNYLLARVSLGSQNYFIDATDPVRPMELLPLEVLNVKGLVLKKNDVQWVTLTSPKRYTMTSLALINTHEDGSLDGTFEDAYREYANLFQRQSLKNKKDIDVIKESFETEEAGMTVDSIHIESLDSIQAPLKLKAWISTSNYAQQNGDLIYINPHMLHRIKENPFKLPTRKFPIDYSYQRSSTHVVTIILPSGFEVKENVVNRSFGVSDFAAYSQEIHVDSNKVQMVTKLDISKAEVPAKYYTRMREFYSQVVASESEQLVLARINKQVSSTPKAKISLKKGKK
jgi:hypothetical protein